MLWCYDRKNSPGKYVLKEKKVKGSGKVFVTAPKKYTENIFRKNCDVPQTPEIWT